MFEVESGCLILVRCGKKNMGSTTVEEHGIGNRVMLTTVNRRHIESLDFEPIFKILRQCGILDPSQASSENLTNLCYKVGVLVDG